MMNNYLLFHLGERLFAVQMQGAIEILPWRRARPVPLAYSYVEGLLDYRGSIYPVLNLGMLLGTSRPGPIGFTAANEQQPPGRTIILLQEGDRPFGITVDSVLKMSRLEEPEGRPPDIKDVNPNLVKGIRSEDDQEIILLGFERLFHAG